MQAYDMHRGTLAATRCMVTSREWAKTDMCYVIQCLR